MVLSKISDVSYPELKSLDKNDVEFETDMYQILVNDIDIIIAIGNVKNTFEEQNVLYYPIYIVTQNESVMQIGVFEIMATSSDEYTDISGNLNIEKENISPLLYTFATKDFLLKHRMIPEISLFEKDETKEKEIKEIKENIGLGKNADKMTPYEIPEIRKEIFILTPGVIIPKELIQENEKHAKDYKEKYHESKSDNWVQKFMQNENYNIIDNEGGGDCLFSTIRDAFSSIAQQTSVEKLRKKVSEEVDNDIFQIYKDHYDMYQTSILLDTNKLKELSAEHILLKQRFSSAVDSNEEKKILDSAKKIKLEHDRVLKDKKISANYIKDYKFMKGVETLEQLKKKVRTCDFWADLWTISNMERILNIKFIILSSESYKSGDANVLQCGEMGKVLQMKGVFNPEFYIILDYTGSHYKTISYKKKLIFKFTEIPYDIRKMILDKCMERNAGPFDIIPDFQKLKSSTIMDVSQIENYDEFNEAKLKGLYDDNIVFQFYSKSVDKPPGMGAGEKMEPKSRLIEFKELASIKDWRKKLSNFWVDNPFTLDDHKWVSVEHYYQGSKFKKNNPEFYLSFSLDSGTDLSKDAVMAKSAGGKTGKYQGKLIRPIQVQIDPDFFGKRSKKEMYDAQYAKFTQVIDSNKEHELKKLLLATKDAKLTHFMRGHAPVVFDDLMIIRDKLKRETS
jgi:predicted NAD-dependent protein-ADP-ribosyltransferase YbiA (DUF1768 family)